MTKQEELLGKGRVTDGMLAEFLGWTDLKIIRQPGPPPSLAFAKYLLVGTPPHAPFTRREVPHFHSDIDAAKELADLFGLEAKHRRRGWFVRPKAAFAADPNLDSHSDEGHHDGPRAICEAVVTRVRGMRL
jgi:hypothetical protein